MPVETKEEKFNEKFNEIFQQIVRQAQYEHPPVYCTISKEVEIVFSTSACTRTISEPVSTMKYMKYSLKSIVYETIDKQKFMQTLTKSIDDILSDVQRYEEKIVSKCIMVTNTALNKRDEIISSKFKREVFLEVKKLLTTRLRRIQKNWDKKNSVSARFEASREEMKMYFESINSGYQGAQLLRATIVSWLQLNLQHAFEEELAMLVFLKLKVHSWVSNGEVMQACIDKDLIQLITREDIIGAIECIRDPLWHMNQVINDRVGASIRSCAEKHHVNFLKKIRMCILTASSNVDCDAHQHARQFIRKLREELNLILKQPTATFLISKLPNAKEDTFNCDDQPEIFNVSNEDYVCRPMLEEIQKSKNSDYSCANVIGRVLGFFNDYAHGADNGVRPRCGEPCPQCFSPCTRTRGHSCSDDVDDNRHNTHHQPVGLAGQTFHKTCQLVPKTCNAKDCSFLHSDGKWYRFSMFSEVFPDWCQPTEATSLHLREHIFYYYQNELVAATPGAKPCKKIPKTFARKLDSIQHKINELCGP